MIKKPIRTLLSQTGHFVILLCLTPDDITRQGRAFGWGRVNGINSKVDYISIKVDHFIRMKYEHGIRKILSHKEPLAASSKSTLIWQLITFRTTLRVHSRSLVYEICLFF